jgi:hypothetical protein
VKRPVEIIDENMPSLRMHGAQLRGVFDDILNIIRDERLSGGFVDLSHIFRIEEDRSKCFGGAYTWRCG